MFDDTTKNAKFCITGKSGACSGDSFFVCFMHLQQKQTKSDSLPGRVKSRRNNSC